MSQNNSKYHTFENTTEYIENDDTTTFEADTITITHQGGLYLSLFMLHRNTQKITLQRKKGVGLWCLTPL
jgi:hypothetical protein